MMLALITFIFSLVGIVGLLAVKAAEERRGARYAPHLRESADERARLLKSFAYRSREEFAKLPPFFVMLSRFAVHEAALGTAALARFLERQAHRLAELVSHKRGFERKETKSEFLKQVTDFKIRSGQPLEEKDEV